jgi:hypothetical protein
MEAISSSESLVNFRQTTWRYITRKIAFPELLLSARIINGASAPARHEDVGGSKGIAQPLLTRELDGGER